MTILARDGRQVKPARRPFELVFDSRHPDCFRSTRTRPFAEGLDPERGEWAWFTPPPSPVVRLMRHLNYPPCNIDAALSWIEHRGTVAGCPVVEPWHAGAIDDAAGLVPTFPTPCHPETYHPSHDDAAWADRAFRRDEPSPKGLIPRRLAEAVASMGNPW